MTTNNQLYALRAQERTSLQNRMVKTEVQHPKKLNDFEFGLRHNTAKKKVVECECLVKHGSTKTN
jgi:hypothetical protein